MPRPATSFSHVAGVALHYDRTPQAYGTRGHPRSFFMTEAFHRKLDACFEELWEVCPLGTAEVVATAGAWVEKPGAHGRGRGFDIDAIFWAEKAFVTLHYPTDSRFYLGVDAILRKHFGTVLNYRYNEAHEDHFHVDDLAPVGFVRTHRSRVLFVQMALGKVFGTPVDVDGRWGPQSAGAVAELLERLDFASPDDPSDAGAVGDALEEHWTDVLDAVAEEAFADLRGPAARTPAELLRAVYDLIDRELAGSPIRKRLEATVTAFAEHPDVAAVLDEEEPDPGD